VPTPVVTRVEAPVGFLNCPLVDPWKEIASARGARAMPAARIAAHTLIPEENFSLLLFTVFMIFWVLLKNCVLVRKRN
jgi:hypothetical protein